MEMYELLDALDITSEEELEDIRSYVGNIGEVRQLVECQTDIRTRYQPEIICVTEQAEPAPDLREGFYHLYVANRYIGVYYTPRSMNDTIIANPQWNRATCYSIETEYREEPTEDRKRVQCKDGNCQIVHAIDTPCKFDAYTIVELS